MKKRFLTAGLSLLLFTALILSGCGNTGSSDRSSSDEAYIGEFTAVTHTGDSVDQSIFAEADLTMINVWTTFCGYCIDEMPTLEKLSKTYADQNFQIVGMVSDVFEAGDATVQDIIDTTGVTYPQIIASEELQTNFLQNVQSVPTTVFVNSKGQLIGKPYIGMRDEDGWASIIEQSLELVQ